MDAFWKAWAARVATEQWHIFGNRRAKTVPPVANVEADPRGVFLVTFENGDVLQVEPSGIARPHLALLKSTR